MSKTILITGASSGIGQAAAHRFAAAGWNVVATMRSPEKETELTHLPNVLVQPLDVQDRASIDAALGAGLARFGQLDVVLNNAGMGVYGAFELATRQQIRQQFEVNVFGVMEMMQAVLPHFRAQKAGLIINISSQGGRITFPAASLYHATKFAIEGFSESVAYELAPLGIRVKLVEPGNTDTQFSPGATLTANPAIPDYQAFVDAAMAHFATLTDGPEPVEAVVETIYAAATDGTSQLRYVVGEDSRRFIGARQSKGDQEYIDWMRQTVVPPSPTV